MFTTQEQIGWTIEEFLNHHSLKGLVDSKPSFDGVPVSGHIDNRTQHSEEKFVKIVEAGGLSAMFTECELRYNWTKYLNSNNVHLWLNFQYKHPCGRNGVQVDVTFDSDGKLLFVQ